MNKKQADLQGLRVLNTRPAAQAVELNEAILAAGGQPIACPTLAIHPLCVTLWRPYLPPLEQVEIAIFTSVNAVQAFFQGLKEAALSWPSSIQVLAIGPATARSLTAHHITVQATPAITDSEHLLALACLQKLTNKTILLVQGEGGRTLIADTIKAQGAKLFPVNVYQRGLPSVNKEALISLWQNDAIDIIVLTSQLSMQQLFVLFEEPARRWLQEKPCVVISTRLAQAARALGIKQIILSSSDSIINTLDHYQGRLLHERKQEPERSRDSHQRRTNRH